jgi:GTP-binding protein HflX
VTRRQYPHTGEEHLELRDRAVLVGVDRGSGEWPLEESLSELSRLAGTAGAEVVATASQRLDKPNPRTFIGAGKAEEVAALAKSSDANVVVFDDELTPRQQANVEDLIPDTRILDRTALILEIFALHATTREGKLQVELAQLEYLLPRLRGMWGHLERERLGGGRGARFGAGESQLETDRRIARRRIAEVRRELEHVSGERKLQRKSRARSGIFRVSLVGYTNAGKSTLLNRMTGADVLAYDMLFATLDSTTRKLTLPEGREITLTDTVGFIHKLPHNLVDAFKSTLDEVREADLLLHVVDSSHPQRVAQMRAVGEVLAEIGAADKPAMYVFNKTDALGAHDGEAPAEALARLQRKYPSAVFVSGLTGDGVDALLESIAQEAARRSVTLSLAVPFTRGEIVRLAHERAQVVSERHTENGTQLVLRVPSDLVPAFSEFVVDGAEAPQAPEQDP